MGTLAPRNASAGMVAGVTPCTEPAPAHLGTTEPAASKVRAALNNSLGWGGAFVSPLSHPHAGKASMSSARQAQA